MFQQPATDNDFMLCPQGLFELPVIRLDVSRAHEISAVNVVPCNVRMKEE
jgi:hypothetical protein